MSDLPASHYLGIYIHRVRMAGERKKQLKPGIIEGAKQLVDALQKLPPNELIHLEADWNHAIFTKTSTGELLARIPKDQNEK